MCELYGVPESQKTQRLVLHLEGTVLEYAHCWLDAYEGVDPTCDQLVAQLQKSFQKVMKPEEAQLKLHGRTWNIFEITIDEFTHDT